MTAARLCPGLLLAIAFVSCAADSRTPTAPMSTTAPAAAAIEVGAARAATATRQAMERVVDWLFQSSNSGALAVAFPPRNEPAAFREALEVKYREGLRRSRVQTYVDAEGSVVWTMEYLRYRVSQCSHAEAVAKVMNQIDGQGVPPPCSNVDSATFPPRNEPLAFMQQLEVKYRDTFGQPAGGTYVDVEGNIVWTQEYLRYRLSSCGHAVAQQKVFDQIDGRGIQAECSPTAPSAGTFWN